ncbi:MAG TPA: Ig-like domain-containing protein, partial [Actinomycetota bacterium]|nr:Ig-like domain-containing protein [Actinomycetota bacterium]
MKRSGVLTLLVSVVLMSMSVAAGAAGQPPESREDRYTVKAGRQLVVSAADGLLANDSDPEGDKLTAVLSHQRPPGKLSLRPDGSFRYTPISSGGNDFFSYTAFDGQSHSPPTFVIIRVDAAPITQPDSYGVIAPAP